MGSRPELGHLDHNNAELVSGLHGPPLVHRNSGGKISQTDDWRRYSTTGSNFTNRPRTQSPDERRRSISSTAGPWLNQVPEDAEMSVEEPAVLAGSATPTYSMGETVHRYYGSFGAAYPSSASMEVAEDDEMSEQQEEWLLDEELAQDGLYRGNYKSLMALYTFVPLTTLLALVILGLVPILVLREASPSPFPYPQYLPFPLPEALTAAALWSLSYLLRDTFYSVCQFLTSCLPFPTQRFPSFIPVLTTILSETLQSASTLLFRQLAVPILLIPFYSTERFQENTQRHKHHFPTWEDGAFKRIWWVALGWAAAEAIVGIKQGYESIALYKDVLVSVRKNIGKGEVLNAVAAAAGSRGASTGSSKDATSQLFGEDTSLTPTQKDIQGRPRPLSEIGVGGNSDPVRRREHSSSISSTASGPGYVEELHGSALLGERQPLLTLNRPIPSAAASLVRRPTNESERLLVENEVERDLEELLRLKSREELEEVYGIPVIQIPVFISCLHRINSVLSSLGVCLILSAAYMRSTLAYYPPLKLSELRDLRYWTVLFSSHRLQDNPTASSNTPHPFPLSNHTLIIAFPSLLLIQTLLSLMHTPWVLPKIGIHTYVYVCLLVWLGVFFGALGFWEALT